LLIFQSFSVFTGSAIRARVCDDEPYPVSAMHTATDSIVPALGC
jgi:hypothetical protein